MSRQLYSEMCKLLEDKQLANRHSLFQLKHFVVGKELTVQAKLRRCLTELNARKESIENLTLSIEEMKDDLKLLELKIDKIKGTEAKSELHSQWQEIQIRKLERRKISTNSTLKNLRRKMREQEEEANFFLQAYLQLEKLEPLKSFDDLEENTKLWDEIYSQELQLRLLLGKPIDLELVKCILALDKESAVKQNMVGILSQLQQQAEAAQSKQARIRQELDQQIQSARLENNGVEEQCQKEFPA